MRSLTVGAVETTSNETRKRVSIGLDSGAELTVWSPNLIPEVETKSSKDSRAGVKYYGPGDVHGPTLADQGERNYRIDFNGVRSKSKVHVVAVRKPLLAMCDLEDRGRRSDDDTRSTSYPLPDGAGPVLQDVGKQRNMLAKITTKMV